VSAGVGLVERRSYPELVDALTAIWQDWAALGERLTGESWLRPTRCVGWDVRAVYAHHSAFPLLLTAAPPSPGVPLGPPLAASEVLRRFNAPGGVAHALADRVAAQARAGAAAVGTDELVERFRTVAPQALRRLRDADPHLVIPWATAETPTSVRELLRIVLLEGTVHLLDVLRALDEAPDVPAAALDVTAAVLADMAPAVQFVEYATGRTPASPFPLLR
jgi:uncharacterized protein (TIGR03083 family)